MIGIFSKPKPAQKMGSWRLAARFARRELRGGTKGFGVFLACLILGVAAIAGVQSLSKGLSESLAYDSKYILGGDIALKKLYTPATPEEYKFLQRIGPITAVAETRAMTRRMDDSKAVMVELKGVDPFYPLYGSLAFADEAGNDIKAKTQDLLLPNTVMENGVAVDKGDWGAVVEKELLSRLNVHIGDQIKVGNGVYIIRAVITREPDRIGSARFTLAPRVMISSYSLDRTGLAAAGNQIYYDYRLIVAAIAGVDDLPTVQKKITAAFPDEKWKGRNYYNAAPQIKRGIDQLTLFLTLIGLTTLLIGGVGISNAVRAFLDGKLASIATLKCLGASSRFTMRVYMLQILCLSALGIAAGLLLGAGLSLLGGHFVTAQLSLTNKVGIYPLPLLLAAGFGVLTVVCFSLWPLGRAVRISPRALFRDLIAPASGAPDINTIAVIAIAAQALALLAILSASDQRLAVWFIGGAIASFGVFHLYAAVLKAFVARLHLKQRPEARLALANLHRPGNATANIILSLGLGLTVLSAIALVEYNMSRLLGDDLAIDAPSFFFLDIEPAQKDAFVHTLEQHAGVRGVKLTPSLHGRIVEVNGVDAHKALKDPAEAWVIKSDRGFTYTSTLPPYSHITAGQWWPADFNSKTAGVEPQVSIATDVAKAFDIGVGDHLTVNVMGVDFSAAVANVRDIDWASFTMNFAVTFAPGALDDAPANYLATAIVDENVQEALQGDLAAKFPNVTSVRVREALEAAQKFIGGLLQAVRLSAATTLIAGILVLAGGIAAARRRHFYDAVILKVLGATRGRILKTFVYEYLLLGIATVLIAGGIGAIAAYGVIDGLMGLTFQFSLGALGGVIAFSLIVTLAAGFFGTFGALKRKPAPYLRNQ